MVLSKCKIVVYLPVFLLLVLWFANSTLSQELIARWPLDEGSGKVVTDVIGGNEGTFVGDLDWVEGKFDGGLKFDGATTHVVIPRNPDLEPADSVTFSAWVKINGVTGRQEIITCGDSYFISLNEGGAGVFRGWIHQGGGWPGVHGTTKPKMGTWYFVAMTYDGTDVKIYVDGKLEGAVSAPGKIDYLDLPIRFGKHHAMDWVLDGVLDEVEIWDGAMTEDEILAAFEKPLPSAVSSKDNLAATWGQLKLRME